MQYFAGDCQSQQDLELREATKKSYNTMYFDTARITALQHVYRIHQVSYNYIRLSYPYMVDQKTRNHYC
jgi:hypothetical protein